MIQYPAGLPLPLREGYGFTPQNATLRTEMQSGRARKRRLYASVPTVTPVRWLFTAVEAQQFEIWYEDVLGGGVEWFELRLKTPQGFMLYKTRFVEGYNGPAPIGTTHWQITADVELWEKPVLKGGWGVYAPEYIRWMSIFDQAMNREWPQ